jgi:Delta24-sterol reductase
MGLSHQRDVEQIAAQVKVFYETKKPFRIFHGSTNSTRILSFKRDEMLDVSHLNRILSINADRHTAIVEPNVPMDQLLDETLRYGLLPPVITEFPGITVGGGIQGGAGESSSFKWGFLNQATNWHEYILGDGRIVRCSPREDQDPELFYEAAGSCGSLGVITAAELQLIPAKKYVALTYHPVDSSVAAIQLLQDSAAENHDFVDGIMFGANHGVIITGKLTDEPTGRLQRFSRAYDPWFYLHAQKIDAARQQVTETVPLRDYLFRYDRGAFWVGRFAFERFGVPFNHVTRFLLDPLLHTRKLYQALQSSGASQEHIVQDLTVPLAQASPFLDYLDDTFNIYPLWLCPLKPGPRSPLLCNGLDTPLAINVGVWGPRIESYDEFVRQNKEVEAGLRRFGGKKWLYAHTYYTEEEFWKIYDKQDYDRLRRKYSAETLPDLYQKTCVKKRYEVNAKRGLFRTILGQARLRIHD